GSFLFQGSSGQPRQVTRTGYSASVTNPSAQNRRVAATAAWTFPFARPYLTLTTPSGGITQANLGVVPPIFRSSYRQVTSSMVARAPLICGPRRTSIDGTSTRFQIRARRRYASRSAGVTLLSVWAAGAAARRTASAAEEIGGIRQTSSPGVGGSIAGPMNAAGV